MKVKYTKGAIDALPRPSTGQKIYWFEGFSGFGVRITPNARSLVLEKRVDGVKRRALVSKVPDVFDPGFLKRAEATAKALDADFALGIDPVMKKRRQAADQARQVTATLTLRDAFQRYADADKQKGTGKGTAKKPRTKRDIEKVAENHFKDWLAKPVTAITSDMVTARHKEIIARADAARIKAGKPATERSAQADLAMRYLRATMNHINDATDDDEPVIRPKIIKRVSRVGTSAPMRKTRHVSDAHITEWFEAVRTGFEGREFGTVYRDALMFIMLTGARLAEAMGNDLDGYPALSWGDVDLEKCTVTFRNTKNRSDHTMPMGKALVAMMAARKEMSVSDVVFSDEAGQVPATLRGGYDHVMKLTGIYATPHDLRRTFATVAARMDISEFKLKRLLNHTRASDDENASVSNSDTTSGYIHISTDDLREPMQRIEDYMLREPEPVAEAGAA